MKSGKTKTITFKFDMSQPFDHLKHFKVMYDHFMEFEHTTPNKELWLEQKKYYDEILNAPDPHEAARNHYTVGKIGSVIAAERLMKK